MHHHCTHRRTRQARAGSPGRHWSSAQMWGSTHKRLVPAELEDRVGSKGLCTSRPPGTARMWQNRVACCTDLDHDHYDYSPCSAKPRGILQSPCPGPSLGSLLSLSREDTGSTHFPPGLLQAGPLLFSAVPMLDSSQPAPPRRHPSLCRQRGAQPLTFLPFSWDSHLPQWGHNSPTCPPSSFQAWAKPSHSSW